MGYTLQFAVTQRLRVAFMVFMALPIPESHIIQPSAKTGNRFKAKKLPEKGGANESRTAADKQSEEPL